MTEEIDDLEFFQQDFTTASNWEIFTARLEEIFHEWKLPFVSLGEKLSRNQLSLCDWTTCQEIINFADVEMKIVRFTAKLGDSGKSDSDGKDEGSRQCQAFMDLMSLENDYSILDVEVGGSLHPIARLYGLRDFVVVLSKKQPIYNESQIRILLSSVHIAVAESNCEVPVFIEVIDKSQTYPIFMGVCEFQSTRLSFNVMQLQTTPRQLNYLSGLLDMFKGKIGVQYEDPVSVSVRLSYRINQFGSATHLQKWSNSFATNPFDFPEDEEQVTEDDQEPFTVLPFGAMCDPVDELVLYCTWPNVADNIVIDSQTYSDFDPLLAPKWSLRARYQPLPACFLSEVLKEYLHNLETTTTLSELLGDSFTSTGAVFETNPLDVLTESRIPSLSSVLPTVSRRGKENQKSSGPIRDDLLQKMLYYLFPDAQANSPHPYNVPKIEHYDPLKIKSAPPDSLVHRLSALLALCQEYFGGKKAVAHLWKEFAQEMRYRVEMCIPIPGIGNGFPDSRTCLMHQKLQMLNICMERRCIREGGLPFSLTSAESTSKGGGNEGSGKKKIDDSEDEFFDCANDDDEDDGHQNRHAPWNKPEGRLSRLGDMTLVDSDEPLYIPITQEPVPKTEDQLEDDAEVMLKLGPGSELGTQMMSASLLSDMESFKAANPNGKIEDFIRWYSPRDWIEDATDEDEENSNTENEQKKKGHLSSRMMIPGNTWSSVWDSAKPVPARRQRRLFDDTKEAEKVLHFLESRNIGQIAELTTPTLFHTAILKIQEEIAQDDFKILAMTEEMEKIVAQCCKLSRENWLSPGSRPYGIRSKKWQNLLLDLANMEYHVLEARSLIVKVLGCEKKELNDWERNLLSELLKEHECELKNGSKGEVSMHILRLFEELNSTTIEQKGDGDQIFGNKLLHSPIERQFILRVSGKTLVKGMAGPQFLRAIMGQNQFRLCGAFSQDTNFL